MADTVFDSPLAILTSKLETILHAVGPRLVLDHSSLQELLDSGVLGSGFKIDKLAYTPDDDEDEDEDEPLTDSARKPYRVTSAGVAIIPISGMLMKKGGLMSALSGSASYSGVTSACKAAMDDPAVRGLLLDVDSPGGTVHGMFEATDCIYSMRGAGKPIYALANDQACSAAYALASAADKLYLTRTAGVGSVGVFSLHRSQAALDDKLGVAYTYIHFGAKKVAGNEHELLSKSAKSDKQAMVDRMGEAFVATVARNRGIDPKAVSGTEAAVLFADSACPLFADKVATFDECLADLTGRINASSTTYSVSNATIVPKAAVTDSTIQGDSKMADTATLIAAEQAAVDAATAFAAKKAADDLKAEADRVTAVAAAAAAKAKADADAAALAATAIQADATPAGASNAAAVEIAQLCALSGFPVLAADYIATGKTVAQVRQLLMDKRAAESAALSVNPHFGAVSMNGLDAIDKATTAAVANSGGKLSRSSAMEMVLKANSHLYEQAEEEKIHAMATPKSKREYIAALQKRLPSMGLSAVQS